MQVHQVHPVFRIFDEAKAREFYLDYLGFRVVFEHRFEPSLPLYMEVERGGLALHLSGHHGDGSPGAVAFVRMTGLREFHAELTAKNYRYLRPGLNQRDWGLEMVVTDPFHNSIRFCENITASE